MSVNSDAAVNDVNQEDREEITIRPGTPEDHVLIHDSWRKSYNGTTNAHAPTPGDYGATQRQVIDICLETSDVAVITLPDMPDQIIGWICYRRTEAAAIIHWLHVKKWAWGRRFGELLIKHAVGDSKQVFYTHSPRGPRMRAAERLTAWLNDELGRPARYNPWLIFSTTKGSSPCRKS